MYAALARSLGISTRLLNGVVYSQDHNAFIYHTWVESYIDNRWQAIDPTFGQRHADATHIALIEGEELADLTSLLPLLGRLEIELD
jgi:transglutaminase-like putative cysteine protease